MTPLAALLIAATTITALFIAGTAWDARDANKSRIRRVVARAHTHHPHNTNLPAINAPITINDDTSADQALRYIATGAATITAWLDDTIAFIPET